MLKHAFAALVVGGMICVNGCSSGDDDPITSNKATFLDNGVYQALPYQCGDHEGVTDIYGQFEFEFGQGCTFSMGELRFRVPWEKIIDDFAVTVFDITSDKDEADILSTVLQTAVLKRTTADYHHLNHRIVVNMRDGKLTNGSAIDDIFAYYEIGRINKVTVEDAVLNRSQYMDHDGNVTVSLEAINEAIHDEFIVNKAQETDNYLDLYVFDATRGPAYLYDVTMKVAPGDDWSSKGGVKGDDNPELLPPTEGNNWFQFDWYVRRHGESDTADWFNNYLQSNGQMPPSIVCRTINQDQYSYLTTELNFAFHIDELSIKFKDRYDDQRTITCYDVAFAQGNDSPGIKGVFDVIKDIYKIELEEIEEDEGDFFAVYKQAKNLKDLSETVTDLLDSHNIWIASGLQTEDDNRINRSFALTKQSGSQDTSETAIVFNNCTDNYGKTASMQIAYPGNNDDYKFNIVLDYQN